MRGVKGKGAALCGCQGKEGRQRVPGEDGILAWVMATTSAPQHTSPRPTTMFRVHGAVSICDRDVFLSRADFEAAVSELAALRACCRGNDEDKESQARLDKIMGDHARGHLNQLLFVPPVIKAGTDIFVVDLLHCVQLNVAKTAWKYSFADKLDEKGRERATAYMESIGCYLDLRAKGQRNPENKFMTGASVDDYLMGRLRDHKSKSPGFAANTLAMCKFAYGGKRQAAAAATTARSAPAAAAATAAHPLKQQSCGTRRRRAGPSLGFCAGGGSDTVVAEDGSAEPAVELAELMKLDGSDELTDSTAMHSFLKQRFRERAASVLSVLRLWEAFAKEYSA
eukprot:2201642-Pleurochrysis_carterae.AAC.1